MNYDRIFSISSTREFEKISLEVFRHQYHHVAIYRKFCDLLKISPQTVTQLSQIPFLPIEFFKSHAIIAQGEKPQITFTSSGTTGAVTSKHLVSDLNWYEKSFNLAFESFYGKIQDLVIL